MGGMPWKEIHPDLPENYQRCQRRLWNLVKRLQQEPSVLKEYVCNSFFPLFPLTFLSSAPPHLLTCPSPPLQMCARADRQLADMKASNASLEKQVAELGAQATLREKALVSKTREWELLQLSVTKMQSELKSSREELTTLQMEVWTTPIM